MKYSFREIHEELLKIKDIKEIAEYKEEIDEIEDTLNHFDR